MKASTAALLGVSAVVLVTLSAVLAVVATDGDGLWSGHREVVSQVDRPGLVPGRAPGGVLTARAGGEADYLTRMVAHHREAVTAAGQLQRSRRGPVRRLGVAIVTSQTAQIEQMQQWLDEWYPVPSDRVVPYEPVMRDLTGLSGDDLDRLFLRDMVAHHGVAVRMSQQLLMRGSWVHDEVATLARTIRDEQHAEMLRMQRWLLEWYDAGGRRWQHAAPWTGMMGTGAMPGRTPGMRGMPGTAPRR